MLACTQKTLCTFIPDPDRTKKEIEEQRQLVKELKERRDNGEENIGIRNGKVIQFGNPFRNSPQFCWG